jgi:protocatechuate 3,4-dioxygenase beta subunit
MSLLEKAIDTEVQVDWPPYRSTALRVPKRPLVPVPDRLRDLRGPVFGEDIVDPLDNDLTRRGDGEPLGERIIVQGRVLGEDARPIRGALVEIWQANAAGRYRHEVDRHPAPLDPNFTGAGRCLTDDEEPRRRRWGRSTHSGCAVDASARSCRPTILRQCVCAADRSTAPATQSTA